MIVRIVFRFGRRPSMEDLRQIRYRRLINAAARTPYYEPWILAGTGWSERELTDLPCVEIDQVRTHPEQFRAADAPPPPRPEILFPFPRPSRTAVLGKGYLQSGSVQCFPAWTPHLNLYEPEVLAGSVARLRSLARAVARKRIRLAPPKRAVLAFSGPELGALDAEDRDLFWSTYQVPLFEQFQLAGETVASECDAHSGLHFYPERAIVEFRDHARGSELVVSCLRPTPVPVLRWATGFTGHMCQGRCGCGQASPRLEIEMARALPAPSAAPPRRMVMAVGAGR